jgi:predicted membrane protein
MLKSDKNFIIPCSCILNVQKEVFLIFHKPLQLKSLAYLISLGTGFLFFFAQNRYAQKKQKVMLKLNCKLFL